MKITDVSLTLFAWAGIPTTTYGRHTGRSGGTSQLGREKVRLDGVVRDGRIRGRPALLPAP